MTSGPILTINSGSSSLKLGVFAGEKNNNKDKDNERPLCQALVDGLGKANAKLEVRNVAGVVVHSEDMGSATAQEALRHIAAWLPTIIATAPIAVGHRVVHGGPNLTAHQLITPDTLDQLRGAVHFAPLHIPAALALIEAAQKIYPGIPQYACFDTAFHRTLPEEAARFPLPDNFFQEGLRRYGFHGLSYESILYQLGSGRPDHIVIAHLGNGASLAAIKNGASVDTTMGLTPTGGIPMGTRSGDLDPGVVLYLMRNKKMSVEEVEDLLNHNAGLLALSGTTADMRELQASAASGSHDAQLAIRIFTRSIKKTIAAYAAILGGLDLLVFTGGIGEHSASVRAAACASVDFLGIQLDAACNESNAPIISFADSRCEVRVMKTDEDRQIARHCRRLISQ
jgi:acetate kinase